jgi:hypothetical protein
MFYFAYAGNKRSEIKEYQNLLNSIKYKTVVEPFGGSCAFSISEYNKNKNINICISDIDTELILFCNEFYKYDDKIIKNVLDIIKNISSKSDYDIFYKKSISKILAENIEDFLTYYLFKKVCYRIRPGLYYMNDIPKLKNVIKYKDELNIFFKNNKYIESNYKLIFDKYKDDEEALIFLDPPYINSDCSFYDKFDSNFFNNLWEDIYNLLENGKCKIILVVNDNFFMKKCYNKWFYNCYYKRYSHHTAKQTTHNIFTNIKL